MKMHSVAVAGALMLACLSSQAFAQTSHDAHGQPGQRAAPSFDAKGIARTETVRHDFDSGTDSIQVRVDFAPGASFPRHSHPGVEIAYVLGGWIEYEVDGQAVRLQAGQSLYIPAGVVHGAKNTGTGITSELATYLVEKDKPIVILER